MLVPIALAITLAVFLLTSLIPGGAVAALLNGRPTSDENVANLRAKYGLDQPLVTQYWDWLTGVVQGDLGRSFRTSQLVSDSIKDRFLLTVTLNSFALTLAVLVGVPLGTWAAMRRGRTSDRAVVGLTVFGSSAPSFVVALLFLWMFAQKLGLFPLFGAGDGSIVDSAASPCAPGNRDGDRPDGLGDEDHAGLDARPDRPGPHLLRPGSRPVGASGDPRLRIAQRAHPGAHGGRVCCSSGC